MQLKNLSFQKFFAMVYIYIVCFRTHFVHDSDSLVLEDELQRIKLVGECIDIHQVVTGVVCGLLGKYIHTYKE